jgi:RNA polymerase sigma-70 factor, ECF subfamily
VSHLETLTALNQKMIDRDPAEMLRNSVRRPELFGEFFRQHFDRIVAYLARSVCDPDVALELAAETFAQAYTSRGRFRGSTAAEAEGWIYRIASRQLARFFRRGAVARRAMKRLEMQMPPVEPETRSAVEELADLAGLRSALRHELQRIPHSQRAALWLRVVEELPYADVGRRLDISEQAARTRVSRGLKSLSGTLVGAAMVKEVASDGSA